MEQTTGSIGRATGPASDRPRRRRQLFVAMHWLVIPAAVSAQGLYPGELSRDGYKLPGGFEPAVHLRTYDLDAESLTGAPSSAWALGGWAGLRSPWWGNVFQVGLVGYTSQKLHGPADEDGTRLLAPGQKSITVLGEAFGALRILGQTLTGYRQLVNRPFINPQDNRMVPNTFEAYALTGAASGVSYTGGYITKIKMRNSDSFDWMSAAAGGSGKKGVVYAGATWDLANQASLRFDEQYGVDLFNTFYIDGRLPIAIDAKTVLTLGAQSISQKSVGEAQLGSFSTSGTGLQAAIAHGPVAAQLYYTQTGRGADTRNPFGDHASYLNLMQVAFNTAGEKAWGVGGNLDFSGLGLPGLTAAVSYAEGHDRMNAETGASIPNRNEVNYRADYAFAKGAALEGLVATLRYSALRQDGSAQTAGQLRAYVNYAVRF